MTQFKIPVERPSTHDTCITAANEELAKHNLTLDLAVFFDGRQSRPVIRCAWVKPVKGKSKDPYIIPSYCPLCGEPYDAD